MPKFVFVTGGVVSSLGKGITAASLGAILEARGLRVTSPADPSSRGGTITVDVEHGAEVVRQLAERQILVDHRPGAGIRISPHLYTTDEELGHCLDAVEQILGSGALGSGRSGAAPY